MPPDPTVFVVHPDDRQQLASLMATQERLRREMRELDAAINALAGHVKQDTPPADKAPRERLEQPCISTPFPDAESGKAVPASSESDTERDAPTPREAEAPALPPRLSHADLPPTAPPKLPQASNPPVSPRNPDSLELQLGTVWLVRVGILVLITGLVFAGNYAYQSFIGLLGPWGRLALLYIAGGGLCAVAAGIERGKESLRNYSRVLAGGGIATLYYATYAAHFVERLKVIENPITAGVFLLILSAGIIVFADRKRSETLASFAVLLSYYTGTINPIAQFTLFSDLLLTAVAVIFLVRQRWTTLSFLSLIATYVSFGFWHFFHTGNYPWIPMHDSQFWPGVSILTCYWLLFTAGLFLCSEFPPSRRAAFLSLNNGAYFALATMLIRGTYPAAYWTFPCVLGAVAIALACLAQWRMRDESVADGAYLAQGLALISIGLATKLSGYQLALSFALEGAVVLTCCRQRHGSLYKSAAILASGIAFTLGGYRIIDDPRLAMPVGGLLALLFLYDARWSKWLNHGNGGTAKHQEEFSRLAAFFVALALALGIQIIHGRTSVEIRLVTFALTAAFFAYSLPLHGLIELAFLGQFYLLGADIIWLMERHADAMPVPWWNPALLVAATLSIVHWWQGERPLIVRVGIFGQTAGALVAVALLNLWLGQSLPHNSLLLVLPILAVVLMGYGTLTRALPLAIAGQFFVIVGIARFLETLFAGTHPWGGFALFAVAMVTANGMAVERAFGNMIGINGMPVLEPRGFPVVEIYRFLALGMYVSWGFAYVRESWQFAFFSFSAMALFGSGAWSKRPCRIRRSGWLLLVALGTFWAGSKSQVSALNAIAILALLITYHAARRCARSGQGLTVAWEIRLAYPLLATLWLLVTRWVRMGGHGFYTTVAWSVLAALVMGSGFLLRDRCHRRAGLVLLALALGRILLVDVWQLDMGYRIASFLVLGIVLVLLCFVYNRFADRIRTLE